MPKAFLCMPVHKYKLNFNSKRKESKQIPSANYIMHQSLQTGLRDLAAGESPEKQGQGALQKGLRTFMLSEAVSTVSSKVLTA